MALMGSTGREYEIWMVLHYGKLLCGSCYMAVWHSGRSLRGETVPNVASSSLDGSEVELQCSKCPCI